MANASTILAARGWLLAGVLLSAAACGTEAPLALDEPIVVHGGMFKRGKLPGADATRGPSVLSFDVGSAALRHGTPDVSLRGAVSTDAYSVGVRLLNQGTGYWIVPVGSEDPLVPGQLEWALTFDVGFDLDPGLHDLAMVAFDEKGRAGPHAGLKVCVASDLPDNGNVCNATVQPPEAIAALRWDADVDVDLIVIGPDGTTYNRSNFSQLRDDAVVARLDGDGGACGVDGRRIETFVWKEGAAPQSGTWYIYTNLFDACGHAAVHFELTTYRAQQGAEGTFSLQEQTSVGGDLLRAQTKPNTPYPLYLGKIEFP